MAAQTPFRVRGKRGAAPAEKWSHGKQRKVSRSATPSTDNAAPSKLATAETPPSKKRKRTKQELSRLEQLPTEILQVIFTLSVNVNLPLASLDLASQLRSGHLYNLIADLALGPVLDKQEASVVEVQNAYRVMSSKFFTWDFFKAWLVRKHAHGQASDLLSLPDVWPAHLKGRYPALYKPDRTELSVATWAWQSLRPHGELLPPKKLFTAPFSEDRIQMMAALVHAIDNKLLPDRHWSANKDPAYYETARTMLKQAILEGEVLMANSLCNLGVRVETEHVRVAVRDAGCDRKMVSELLTYTMPAPRNGKRSPTFGSVDFLDPTLWSWAEKAENGSWLTSQLTFCARASDTLGISFGLLPS